MLPDLTEGPEPLAIFDKTGTRHIAEVLTQHTVHVP